MSQIPPPVGPVPLAYQIAPPRRRPVSVTVLSIVAIVVYGSMLLCMPLALIQHQRADGLGGNAMRIYDTTSIVLCILMAIAAVVAASLCLVLRTWARRLLVRIAIADLILGAIDLVVHLTVTVPATLSAGRNDPSQRSMAIVGSVVIIAFSVALLVLPICIIYFFRKPHVVKAFEDQAMSPSVSA